MFRRTFAVLLAIALGMIAADRPDFSGTWKLNHSKSGVGAPANASKKITQSDKELKLATSKDGQTAETTLRLDGKANENGVTAKWEGSVLVVRSKREAGGAKLQSEERWMLDGKTLTVSTRVTGVPGEELSMKYVYEKE
jgi:hypothetical protein